MIKHCETQTAAESLVFMGLLHSCYGLNVGGQHFGAVVCSCNPSAFLAGQFRAAARCYE